MFFIKKQPKLTNLKRVPTILFFKKQLKFLTKVLRNYLKNKGGVIWRGGSSGMNPSDGSESRKKGPK